MPGNVNNIAIIISRFSGPKREVDLSSVVKRLIHYIIVQIQNISRNIGTKTRGHGSRGQFKRVPAGTESITWFTIR